MSFATISHSDLAPDEQVHYSFAAAEFDLGGKQKPHYTDVLSVITEAQAHPWLSVEFDETEQAHGDFVDQLKPEDDVLSWATSVANDADAIRAAEDGKDDLRKVYIEQRAAVVPGLSETLSTEELFVDPVDADDDKPFDDEDNE